MKLKEPPILSQPNEKYLSLIDTREELFIKILMELFTGVEGACYFLRLPCMLYYDLLYVDAINDHTYPALLGLTLSQVFLDDIRGHI